VINIGLKRKNFLLCCISIFFVGSFVFGFPGVMASYWQGTFNVGKEDVGRLMFCILIGTGCSMYLTGKLQEKIKYHHLIFFGNIVCAVAMFCVGFATSMAGVYVWALVTGFFCGFVYIPVLTIVQLTFPENRGTSTGMVNLLFGGAAAVVSPFLTILLLSYGAFVMTSIAALLCLAISTTASFFIRLPDNAPGEKQKTIVTENQAHVLSFYETLRLKPFWLLWGVWALAGASGISMIPLSASYGSFLGFSLDQYVWILIGFSITNGAGRMICGRLADYFAHQKILMVCFLISGLAYLILIFSTSLVVVSSLAACVGLAFGAMFAVSAPLVSHCFGLVNFGRIFGLVFTAYGFIAGFLGPWLSGFILDLDHGSFTLVFIYLAIFYFVSSFFIIKIKPVDFS
jgi:OFA family oxalate/formate antiporter-like MFS transporter